MRYLLFSVLSFLCSFSTAQDLCLQEGQSFQMNAPRLQSVWVEKSKIIKVESSPSSLLIKALVPGQSRLRMNEVYSTIHVLSSASYEFYKTLELELKKMRGLKLKCENGKVVVFGELLRLDDWLKIHELYQDRVDYQVRLEMNSSIQKIAEKYFSDILKKHQISVRNLQIQKQAKIKIQNDPNVLIKYQSILSSYGFLIEADTTQIELAPLVRVKITVAEVKKDHTLQYGMSWPSVLSAQQLKGQAALDLNLQALENNGTGKILASPNILCRSGKEAEFFAGGEFPIKIMTSRIQDVIWKKYGVILKVKPVADSSGRMSISIETEVSTIDGSKTVDGVPGLFTNRIQSHFDLTESKTIALSGLIKSEDSKSSQGLPGLSQLPILGPLFGSRDFRENRTELIIFVQPEIVDLEQSSNINLPEEFR